MSDTNTSALACAQVNGATSPPRSVQFLKTLFEHTAEQVYICTFPNERGDPKQAGERHMHTRLPSHVMSFLQKWDKRGRGLFFCVGTVMPGNKRNKENIVETIGLHADLDFKDIDLGYTCDQIVRKLQALQYPPTAIVSSGNGLIWVVQGADGDAAQRRARRGGFEAAR